MMVMVMVIDGEFDDTLLVSGDAAKTTRLSFPSTSYQNVPDTRSASFHHSMLYFVT